MGAWLRRRLAWFFPTEEEDSGMYYPPVLGLHTRMILLIACPLGALVAVPLHTGLPPAWCLVMLLFSIHRDIDSRHEIRRVTKDAKEVGRAMTVEEILLSWSEHQTDPREWLLREAFLRSHVEAAAEQVARSRRGHAPP